MTTTSLTHLPFTKIFEALEIDKFPDYHLTEISCYKNIIILSGDRSYPDRTVDLLDSLCFNDTKNLVAVWDWKGGIWFFWKKEHKYHSFVDKSGIDIPDGDHWCIENHYI